MLKSSVVELFMRLTPEAFLFIFIIQAFSNSKINKNKYVLSSILFSVIILICTFINQVAPIKAITYSLILVSFLALSEALNLYFMYKIFGENIENVLKSPLKKCIYLMPSILVLVIIVLLIFKIKDRRVKDVFN